MSHIRRKFDESGHNDLPRAKTAINYIASLYFVKKIIHEYYPPMAEDTIVLIRNEKVKSILDKIEKWMQQGYPKVLPPGPIGKPIAYALKL